MQNSRLQDVIHVEYQVINMQVHNIVIINMRNPPDCPTEKFINPLSELNKTNHNQKSNTKYHIYTRPELSNY